MNAAILLLVFTLMCFLPLLPGILEVLRPRDRYPLPVDLDYAKDPRYLGNSLRSLLLDALAAGRIAPREPSRNPEGEPVALADGQDQGSPVLGQCGVGVFELDLSRTETVRVSRDLELAADDICCDVLAVAGDLRAGERAVCEREVYVRGDANLAAGVSLRALACDGRVRLGSGGAVLRWLDANGDIEAAERCRLGQHCAAGGVLAVEDGCRFARLFGTTIITPGGRSRLMPLARPPRIPSPSEASRGSGRDIDDVLWYERGDLTIEAGRIVEGDVLVCGDLTIGRGAMIAGSIRAHGALRLGEEITVLGNIVADGPVLLGSGSTIAGNIFGQDTVQARPGVQIGREGAVKSLIGNRGVMLEQGVVVHGYVLTEGEGIVRCSDG